MVTNQDWEAMMNSIVFKEYVKNELKNTSHKTASTKNYLEDFINFENKIKENAELKKYFQNMKNKIASDLSFASKLDKKFVNAIMMLDLEDNSKEYNEF